MVSSMQKPIEPTVVKETDGRITEIYPLPTDESYLFQLLKDIFENHWQHIVFGPIIPGAAFEIQCPNKPTKISLQDGYLTVHFGASHFHLCIGEFMGSLDNPTPPAERHHRRTARAEAFRAFDRQNAPTSWGLQLYNGANEQQMSLFFPNPFLADDKLLDKPDWSRLALWETFCRRYLGQEPDGRDKLGKGFGRI